MRGFTAGELNRFWSRTVQLSPALSITLSELLAPTQLFWARTVQLILAPSKTLSALLAPNITGIEGCALRVHSDSTQLVQSPSYTLPALLSPA